MKRRILFLALITFVQCRDVIEDLGECTAITGTPVSYSMQVYPVISNTCAIPQCHIGNFDYGNFSEFTDIKKSADNGKLKFMIETHQMPHGFTNGPVYLTSCEIETIKKWINEGANNN